MSLPFSKVVLVKLPDGFSAMFADFSCFSLSSYVGIIEENIHANEACTLAPLPSGVHTQATHMYHQHLNTPAHQLFLCWEANAQALTHPHTCPALQFCL